MTTIRVPERYQNILSNSKNYAGLMGLSVGKQEFTNLDIMREYAQFMQDRFLYGIFLIGDYPKKYNIMALEGVSEKKAEERTRIAGDNMRNALERITRDYPLVKVMRWKKFMDEKYSHNLQVLRASYDNDSQFRSLANEIVGNFLNLPSNRTKWKTTSPPIAVAKEYLLDELAGLLAIPFSIPLPVCEIYPERNELHEQIQARQFPFCKNLLIKDDRVFMEAYYEPSN